MLPGPCIFSGVIRSGKNPKPFTLQTLLEQSLWRPRTLRETCITSSDLQPLMECRLMSHRVRIAQFVKLR